VHWGIVDNEMLARGGAGSSVRSAGIWLFCDGLHEDGHDDGVRLPVNVQSEEAAREAAHFILGALAAAKAQPVRGEWHKRRPVKSEL
jgi:hypothetical protein